jgi:transcriptional regulator with XRE-family HTH domain
MKSSHRQAYEDIISHPHLFGQSLRRLRLACDMSLQDAADAARLSKSFLSMVESGQRMIKFEDLLSLFSAYHYSFGWFLTQTRDSFRQSALDEPLAQATLNIVQPRTNGLLMTGERLSESRTRLLLLRPLRYREDSEWLELMLPGQTQLTEKPISLRGEVRGVVQRGTLLLVLDNNEYRAKEGDEFCFDGNVPHIIRNYLIEPLVTTLVITPAAL